MALTPEIDGIVARIGALEGLIAALDGVTPIVVTVGAAALTVTPDTMPEAYQRGSEMLKNVATSAIGDLRGAVASVAIMQSQAPSPEPPPP